MNASLIEILDKFLVVIWPMLRLSAFLAFTSIFSIRAVNMRIRISLAFAMAFFVTQQIEIPKIDPVTADGLMEISRQILIWPHHGLGVPSGVGCAGGGGSSYVGCHGFVDGQHG